MNPKVRGEGRANVESIAAPQLKKKNTNSQMTQPKLKLHRISDESSGCTNTTKVI